ncbi:MAG: oligopeptide/dipeptide ABC transporter ATP-binding protein [Geobacteraceae bacterium]
MNQPLLEARNLRKYFSVKATPFAKALPLKAVNGISFQLKEGETLGLAGESGSGKSTLGKLLLRLLAPDQGEILYRNINLDTFSTKELRAFRKETQMIFQDPYSSLNPRMRIGDIIGEPIKIHGTGNTAGYREQVYALMKRVGLSEEYFSRYPHEFSGGQRQRIGIARALAVSPRLIIADEPVSALDVSIQAQIINLLQELKKEFKLSFLIIAHDLSVLRHMSDRIAVMYLGSIVEIGNTEQVFSGFLHPYTEALLSAVPHLEPQEQGKRVILKGDIPSPLAPPDGCPFHPRCPHVRPEVCAVIPPPLEEKRPGHLAACHFSLNLPD